MPRPLKTRSRSDEPYDMSAPEETKVSENVIIGNREERRTNSSWAPVKPLSRMRSKRCCLQRPFRNWLSGVQLIEQRPRLLQIARLEPLRKPAVNRSQQFARLLQLPMVAPEPGKAHGGAEFPAPGHYK
jgi:hypothetical protein